MVQQREPLGFSILLKDTSTYNFMLAHCRLLHVCVCVCSGLYLNATQDSQRPRPFSSSVCSRYHWVADKSFTSDYTSIRDYMVESSFHMPQRVQLHVYAFNSNKVYYHSVNWSSPSHVTDSYSFACLTSCCGLVTTAMPTACQRYHPLKKQRLHRI